MSTPGLAVGLEIDGDGAHPAAWRAAGHPPATLLTAGHLAATGRDAEAAGFGFVTLGDATPGDPGAGVAGRFDPVTNPNAMPDGFDDVVERLVPELQDRGAYRTAYEGTTLRENLGVLPDPSF